MKASKDVVVRIDHITKTFGSVTAVDDLDMALFAGEFVTFLGPSGCGKSTTLRILGGFEQPDKGRIVLDGEDVTPLPPNKRHVNMVFQDYALFPHMTVAQNIAFGLELQGQTKSQTQARMAELLALLQLDGMESRRPDQLSGGQRQRVALARALAPDPSVLLLDEPLGALDAKLRAQVQIELKDIQKRTGKTFFFVTHDQEEALTMSDRIVVMNRGRVEQDGAPEDLYLRPESRFVAEFIGEANFFTGTVVGSEEDLVILDWNGVKLRGSALETAPSPGQDVTAALRLEMVRFFGEKPETGNAIKGRIVNRVFKGSRIAVDVQVGDKDDAVIHAYLDLETADAINEDDLWVGWEGTNLSILRD